MKSPFLHGLFVGVLCFGVLIGYRVWYGMIETKSATVAALESQIELNAKTESRIAAARASLAEISDYETRIQNYFLAESDVATFNDALESQNHDPKAQVKVLSVAKGGTTAQPTLAFTLSVTGPFDAVMRTIGMIEYAPYALTVSTFTLQKDQQTNVWQANMTIAVSSAATVSSSTTPQMTEKLSTTTPSISL